MSQPLTQSEFNLLDSYAQNGDVVAYYSLLQSKGYGYAALALGVVENNTVPGVTNSGDTIVTNSGDTILNYSF